MAMQLTINDGDMHPVNQMGTEHRRQSIWRQQCGCNIDADYWATTELITTCW